MVFIAHRKGLGHRHPLFVVVTALEVGLILLSPTALHQDFLFALICANESLLNLRQLLIRII